MENNKINYWKLRSICYTVLKTMARSEFYSMQYWTREYFECWKKNCLVWFLTFNCYCIQAVPFIFVSRKFNNTIHLHVMKKKIRTVRIIFLALISFAVPVRNLSCQSWTRRITRRIRDACRNIATVKIERFRRARWARRNGCKFVLRDIKTQKERERKWGDKIEAKEQEERSAASCKRGKKIRASRGLPSLLSKTGTQRTRIRSSSRNEWPSEKLAERSFSFNTRIQITPIKSRGMRHRRRRNCRLQSRDHDEFYLVRAAGDANLVAYHKERIAFV